MIYSTPNPPTAWALRYNEFALALWDAVKVSASGVVHGHGVVARRNLVCNTLLVDPSAIYLHGEPPSSEQEKYIKYSSGYFKVHCFADDPCRKTATTFWLNEARAAVKPNICWKVHCLEDRKVLAWQLLSDIGAGEELVVCYTSGRGSR
jgi:hypothetical protein